MSNNRTIQIPLDHLVAEMIACPLVLDAAYQSAMYAIDTQFSSARSKAVWRATEQEMTSRFPHSSIDELVSLRNRLWFDNQSVQSQTSFPLHEFVRRVAREFLKPRGTYAVPTLPAAPNGLGGISSGEAPDPAARRAWRWLTFALPEDLLLAGLHDHDHSPTHVEIVSDNVAALLRRGYAETHLHYGVAFNFSMAWAAATNIAGRSGSGFTLSAFDSPGAEFSEGNDLAIHLLRGLIVRYLLGVFLGQRLNGLSSQSISTWLANMLSGLAVSGVSISQVLLVQAVKEVAGGVIGFNNAAGTPALQFTSFQRLYNQLAGLSTRSYPNVLSDVQRLDPLFNVFGSTSDGSTVQLQFLRAGFQYLSMAPDDKDFAILFWQVERIRCHVYRHCIQRPMTPGLTNFIRFYERKLAIATPLDKVLIESAAALGGIDKGLASLEVRTRPRKSGTVQLQDLLALRGAFSTVQSQSPGNTLETGLVLHFLKKRGVNSDLGFPAVESRGDYADPMLSATNTSGFRWGTYFANQRTQALAIAGALRFQPNLLKTLRAIDVCRDEPGVPTWVIGPLFELVRRQIDIVRKDWAARSGNPLPKLRATAHVGEDFVHLATGIRFMDEALCVLKLGSGDRVGHGLALGVDVMDWARRSTRLAMPLEDRWFDLIWERCWHAEPKSQFTPARRVFVDDEIIRLANVMFPNSLGTQAWTVSLAMECHRALHDFSRLTRIGFPIRFSNWLPSVSTASTTNDFVDNWLADYLTQRQVYFRCRRVDWVESQHDGEATRELQRLVRQRYSDLGITIEINPISNLLVGDLSDLESHPLWRLAPRLGDHIGPSMRMCVGSDDPFPFATNLPEEYQFLFDSLVLAGRSQAEAREWLDLIREMGLESRFTIS